MNQQALTAIQHALGDARPETALAVGDVAREALAGNTLGECVSIAPGEALAALSQHGVFDVAVLSGVLEGLGQRDASGLLARLRDLHARRIILLVDHGQCGWTKLDITALGLTRLQDWDKTHALYGFDIDTYKTTPDWLNPDYWANPELWDRHRW
ncbi:hypothetical protein DFR31_0430 [Alkalispirillum mobile]|uniref:Uncharacterized protein n=1 Tax=Alkalispirillum mobile TaxID=85925 RepID=A0A498CDK4_9GAMM|nr:DUF6231 family protein [Alkalispirillum mobile]RLK50528.1 hypothetical protein DFR31_0430 [Alkalispirillum mobile]